MKNNIFNFRRFGKYFTSDIRTCTANYGLSLLTMAVLTPIATYALISGFIYLMGGSWQGPEVPTRAFIFFMMAVCLIVTMPVKCYGKLTEKQYGSFWLTLPASRLEKFISMIIITCIIAPIVGFGIYLGIDAIICAIDPTCGEGLMASGINYFRNASEFIEEIGGELTLNFGNEQIPVEDRTLSMDILRQINNPWLYIDDFFAMSLPFLLGAIYFKKGKTVKTFLALAVIGTAASALMVPVMKEWAMKIAESYDADMLVYNMLNNGIFRNFALIDTISDTLVNLAILTGIWFRIKTLKH